MWPALCFKIISLTYVPFEIGTHGVDLLYMFSYKVVSSLTQRSSVKTLLLRADFSVLQVSCHVAYEQNS
jgi:hypothetical protein